MYVQYKSKNNNNNKIIEDIFLSYLLAFGLLMSCILSLFQSKYPNIDVGSLQSKKLNAFYDECKESFSAVMPGTYGFNHSYPSINNVIFADC
jgi:hypothetical protein